VEKSQDRPSSSNYLAVIGGACIQSSLSANGDNNARCCIVDGENYFGDKAQLRNQVFQFLS